MPDKLEPVSMPVTLTLPGADAAIPQQTAITLWLDIWVPEKTPVGRMRIQAVLKSGNQWIIYPMEVRVMEAVVPRLEWKPGPVAPVNERADASICTSSAGEPSLPDTIRQIIRRNALQDAALARSHGVPYQPCEAPKPNAEWYLRIRDRLRVTP